MCIIIREIAQPNGRKSDYAKWLKDNRSHIVESLSYQYLYKLLKDEAGILFHNFRSRDM